MPEDKSPYVRRPMQEYLDEAASNAPTPGGGSVSALAGALGTTMASMAGNFTVGKKKYAEVEEEVKGLLAELDAARAELLAATQSDTEAYSGVGAAYGMPKSTDEEKAARREAIQAALEAAMQPPLEAVRSCTAALRATRRLLDIANKNLITDVGVAGLLLDAAARGAYLNVAVNLNGLKDETLVSKTEDECARLLEECERLGAEVAAGVNLALDKGAG
jgi:formiminotetrahydrofolate cyclodeaminase